MKTCENFHWKINNQPKIYQYFKINNKKGMLKRRMRAGSMGRMKMIAFSQSNNKM